MNHQPKGIHLTQKDLDLFFYLHAVKVATYERIQRDIFKDTSLGSVGNRIRKLEDQRYVDVGRNRLLLSIPSKNGQRI